MLKRSPEFEFLVSARDRWRMPPGSRGAQARHKFPWIEHPEFDLTSRYPLLEADQDRNPVRRTSTEFTTTSRQVRKNAETGLRFCKCRQGISLGIARS